MKTNREMFREYQLNGITVIQRTKDAYFDLNALIYEYNKKQGTKYKLTNFFELPSIKRAINTIYRKEVIEKDFSLVEIFSNNDNINELKNSTLSQKICTNDNINKLAEKRTRKELSKRKEIKTCFSTSLKM